MSWVRLDDQFADHPKIATVGPLAGWLHVRALCYCNRHLTDGFIPHNAAVTLASWDDVSPLKSAYHTDAMSSEMVNSELVGRLIDIGLWEACQGGYQIHDYLEYQPSRESVLADRAALSAKRSAAGKKGALVTWNGKNGKPDGKPDGKKMASARQDVWQTDGPVPVPVPNKDISLAHARAFLPMGEAWNKSGLPGLPDASAMLSLKADLTALSLDPLEACIAFKRLIDAWRNTRGIMCSATPEKMREHLGFVHQIIKGELQPEKVNQIEGKKKPIPGKDYNDGTHPKLFDPDEPFKDD